MAKLESGTPMRRITLPTGQVAKIARQPSMKGNRAVVKELGRRLDTGRKGK